MTRPVTSTVIQPPAANFSNTVMARIVTQSASAGGEEQRLGARHSAAGARCRTQKRSMAAMDSEKVRNTLMEYITIRCPTSPRV